MTEIPDTADYQTALNILNKNILEIRSLIKDENYKDKKQKKINELKEYDINIEEPGYKISQVKEDDIYSKILPQLKIGKQIQIYYTRIITQTEIKIEEQT